MRNAGQTSRETNLGSVKPRFLIDGMLGSLARWLRICGYDVQYASAREDEELIEIARKGKHVLLTRDKVLFQRAKKNDINAHYVTGKTITDRLRQVSNILEINLSPSTTRCPKCNGTLKPTDKNDIKKHIPPKTFETFQEFWLCTLCNSIYWKGGHWDNIQNTLNQANAKNPKI